MSTVAMNEADPAAADQEMVFRLLADPNTHMARTGVSGSVKRIDTHGAVVFLAGDEVYKVKRAVAYPYMDFSTLEKRYRACRREIELNRVSAPEIYRGLVPVVRGEDGLRLGGDDTVTADDVIVEWAVHMCRFDEEATLERVVMREGLEPALISALAESVASSHAQALRASLPPGGLAKVARDIIAGLRAAPELFAPERVAGLEAAFGAALGRLEPLLARRAREGEVRRCHGDLHLRNIVLIRARPVLFDALEFDEALATTDRLYDLAFLLMDILARGLAFEANLLLNRYLVACGDDPPFDGLAALPLFISLRAAIRAEVGAAAMGHQPGGERAEAGREAQRYFDLAVRALEPRPARLVAVGGLSGSGKSTLAARLAPLVGPLPGAVHLRSDVERKRLHGAGELERLGEAAYSAPATQAVYDTLRARARIILAAGHGVVVDAVHQRPEERALIAELADMSGVDFLGLWLDAPVDALARRVEERRGDASDATADIVHQQARRDAGDLDWARIDSSGATGEVLSSAAALLPPG